MPQWRFNLGSFLSAFFARVQRVVESLSATGRVLYYLFAALIILSGVGILFLLNNMFLVEVPAHGGSYTEGIIGTPRFINPVLALSDADNDLTALVYSGLLKEAPDGSFIPDLASSYTLSPDGKTYTVYIRPNATFQDGTPVTADDVIFTVDMALDPDIKSPLQADWEGVTVSELDPHTVQFTLSKPYAPFIENLTMGILPKHLWENVSADEFPFSELNTNPIGSGPYEVESVSHDSSGIPSSYMLHSFSGYALGEPYITTFTLNFYDNESDLLSALQNGSIQAASSIDPSDAAALKGFTIDSVPLSRIFGVFFNQSQNPVLLDPQVRKALSDAVNRNVLVQQVLSGYGVPATGPIPATIDQSALASSSMESLATSTNTALAAREELLAAGWTPGPEGILQKTTGSGKKAETETLSFTLSTGNVADLTSAANYLKSVWGQMGAEVTVDVYDQGDLSENVIRPRKYDALLFGEVIGHGLDLYAFWDSSERNDPGLNIAMYANSTVDSLLLQLRTAQDDATRQSIYQQIDAQIENDMPAVFLYSPDFLYVVPQNVKGIELGSIDNPSNRFDNVQDWYEETDHVWSIFAK